MNEKRRPQGRENTPRRADRFAQRPEPQEETEGQLEGRNAITEALKSGRTIDKVFVAQGDTDKSLQRLAAQAKEAGAVVVPVDRRKLDAMSFTRAHQGIIALAASALSPLLGDAVIAEMTCVGSLLIVALSFNMLGVTKIKVMNFVPAIFFPMLLCRFM